MLQYHGTMKLASSTSFQTLLHNTTCQKRGSLVVTSQRQIMEYYLQLCNSTEFGIYGELTADQLLLLKHEQNKKAYRYGSSSMTLYCSLLVNKYIVCHLHHITLACHHANKHKVNLANSS